jgi:hypothetical protein
MTPIRDNMVRLACSFDGCNAHDDPDRLLSLLGPDEPPQIRADMLRESECALTVRGLWRWLGLVHPRLAPPYKTGAAVEDVVAIARELGAWREPDPEQWPQPGDSVLVAAPEHVFTIVEELAPGAYVSIDGGQRINGAEAIGRVTRRWHWSGGILFDYVFTMRIVRGWVDLDALFG